MFNSTGRSLALATVSALALALPAQAVEEQKFKVTHVFPANHMQMVEGIQIFIDAVTEASGGKITFEVYPTAQLGKESSSVVTSGLADMGLLIPGYETEKLPLSSVVELPGLHQSACEGTAQYWNLAKEGGILFTEEFAKLGVRPIYGVVLPPYPVQTTGKEIDSVADMAGVKLRANGAMAKAVAALGGVPVQVTSSEFYDALARGTVDGGMWLSTSSRPTGVEDLLKHVVKGTAMGSGSLFFGISEKVYQGLDEETRKIFMEAGQKAQQHMCETLDSREVEEEKWLVDNGKLTLHELSADEAKLWNDTISSVADQWAKDMDSTGRPGSQILTEYRGIAEGM